MEGPLGFTPFDQTPKCGKKYDRTINRTHTRTRHPPPQNRTFEFFSTWAMMDIVTQNRTFKAIIYLSQNHYLLTTKIQVHWTKIIVQGIEVVAERTLSSAHGTIEDDSE